MVDPHTQRIFALGLGIREPWIIKDIDLVPSQRNPERLEMHIDIDFTEGTRFNVAGCDEACPVHDTRIHEWRHTNFFQYRCYIRARVPRVRKPDGKVVTVEVPWGRAGSGFTMLMEGVILSLVKHMPVSTVAREIGEHDTRIWRVVDWHVNDALGGQDFSDVTAIGVDEYSHRGHNYITVFLAHPKAEEQGADKAKAPSKARVLFVTEGKDKDAVTRFLERFIDRRGSVEKIEATTSDMIHGFRNAMREAFPNAVVTVDKFHVIANCQTMVDDVRKREMRSKNKAKYESLNKTKYIWLKNEENLTEKQRAKLDELLEIEHLDTVKAYDYRLRLQKFYESHKEYDEDLVCDFEELALEMTNSTIHEVAKFGKSIVTNAVEILNYFITFRTNAILEGFNSKISIIKNRARGFKNLKNFMNMIYFCCGELSMPFMPVM